MRIIYNGIDLMPIETHYYDEEAVYSDDGVDYLYSRFSMSVRALVNGQAEVVNPIPAIIPPGLGAMLPPGPFMSYRFGDVPKGPNPVAARPAPAPVAPAAGPPGKVPGGTGLASAVPGKLTGIIRAVNQPFLTHEVIRHRLSTPRGKLFVFTGAGMETGVPDPGSFNPPAVLATINLVSPIDDTPCDFKNGPFPRLMSISQVHGDGSTLVVDWSCETFLGEASKNGVQNVGILLSNRFSQYHSVDESGYTSIHTEGTAVFRTDLVHITPETPDANRPILFMPIMRGFTRSVDYVRGREDVTGVEYGYTDKQVPVNFVAGPYTKASHIVALHKQGVATNAGVLSGIMTAAEKGLSILVNKRFATGEAVKGEDAAPAPGRRARLPRRRS